MADQPPAAGFNAIIQEPTVAQTERVEIDGTIVRKFTLRHGSATGSRTTRGETSSRLWNLPELEATTC
jgi:hypothetical protein